MPGRRGRRPASDGSILREAVSAAEAIESERTCTTVCNRLCKALVFVVGATGCSISRVDGEYLLDVTSHALRDIELGHATAFRVEDFPLTSEVLVRGEPRAVSFADGDVDPAEAFVLRDLGMNAVLMLPLRVRDNSWGLVELYEMRLRRFSEDDIAVARFLVREAERRLGVVGTDAPLSSHPSVYVLPSPDESPRGPRTR
jgi:transcriptional regulator with GAF, ATPase, and Fis domain